MPFGSFERDPDLERERAARKTCSDLQAFPGRRFRRQLPQDIPAGVEDLQVLRGPFDGPALRPFLCRPFFGRPPGRGDPNAHDLPAASRGIEPDGPSAHPARPRSRGHLSGHADEEVGAVVDEADEEVILCDVRKSAAPIIHNPVDDDRPGEAEARHQVDPAAARRCEKQGQNEEKKSRALDRLDHLHGWISFRGVTALFIIHLNGETRCVPAPGERGQGGAWRSS